jgi:hypothetical protein
MKKIYLLSVLISFFLISNFAFSNPFENNPIHSKLANNVIATTVTSFSPTSGSAGTVVIITGTDFDSNSVVKLGNVVIPSANIISIVSNYDTFSVSQMGTTLSIFVEQIEVGAHYSLDVGSKKTTSASYNAFELYITFDFNRFKSDRRGDNSRFYSL